MKTENATQRRNHVGICVAIIMACLASLGTYYHLLSSGMGFIIYAIAQAIGLVFILRGLFHWRNSQVGRSGKI